jgi:hypothetical protein
MNLKIAQVQYTDAQGILQTGVLAFKDEYLKFPTGGYVHFMLYPSAVDAFADVNGEEIQMDVSQAALLADPTLIEMMSDKIWQLAQTIQFFPDFSNVIASNGRQKRVAEMKSLDELEAAIIPITYPPVE